MKLIITTTYESMNDEVLEWYLEKLANAFPGAEEISKQLRTKGLAEITSKPPGEPVVATTTYKILK